MGWYACGKDGKVDADSWSGLVWSGLVWSGQSPVSIVCNV
jgi:hypothetical protein